jgi:two-component system KDP operon response regulator KdpE
MSRILCVDDEPHLLKTLGANLKARDYDVDLAESGERALELAQANRPDLIILDLGLPGISGIEVIRSLRHWTATPILVLSARDTEFDKIGALDAGADDYVTKPFGMGELLARVRSTLRRSIPTSESPTVETPDFTVDLAAQQVTSHGKVVKLTGIEWNLVEILVRHSGQLVTSREILKAVWGPEYGTETNYLRVHMAHIRRKLEPDSSHPVYFHTEVGMGYRFVPSDNR